jgi:hypothetical protein
MENNTNNKIVAIDTGSKQRAIYNYTKETTDFTTGEIISRDELKISKEDKKENFIKVYIDNLYFMATNLNNSEKTVLFFIIANMNYKNVITISTELRKLIEIKAQISRTTIFTAITGLREKEVLLTPNSDEAREEYNIYSKNSFVLNPNVIGKGSIKDLKKLRQTVVTDFDFDKLEATQEVIRQVEYEGLEDVKNGKDNIKSIDKTYDEEKNERKISVKVAANKDYEIVTLNQKSNDNDLPEEDKILELQLQNSKNRAKELEIEEKKIDLEIMKMRLGQKQGTLFD